MQRLILLIVLASTSQCVADELVLASGAKLTGKTTSYSRGTFHFRTDKGRNLEIRLSNVKSLKFSDAVANKGSMDARIAPVGTQKPNIRDGANDGRQLKELRDVPGETVGLPEGMDIAYFASGSGTLAKNSLPFQAGKRALMFVGFIPYGGSPFVTFRHEEVDEDAGLIMGSIGEDDFGAKESPVFGSKVIYECGPGKAYAAISTQNCRWFVATVNITSIPDRSEIESAGAMILRLAKWQPMPLHK